MEKIIAGIFAIAVFLIFLAAFNVIIAFPVKWCWNYTVVYIWHLPSITWGQAWCLTFLAGILLKSSNYNDN